MLPHACLADRQLQVLALAGLRPAQALRDNPALDLLQLSSCMEVLVFSFSNYFSQLPQGRYASARSQLIDVCGSGRLHGFNRVCTCRGSAG